MNYYTKQNLLAAGKDIMNLIEISNYNGGSAIISEYGGRILGIFPTPEKYSLLWINAHLKEIVQSRQRAIGGDRYWISPERDFFYKNPEIWADWFCPNTLDPANYELLANNSHSCTVSSPISLINQTTKQKLTGEITRQFSIINEPISTGIHDYIGIEIIDDCVFYQPQLKVNGWSLACVISGGVTNPGTVLIPTKSRPKPLSYFRVIPKDRLKIGKNYVAFKIDVHDIYKLAVRPEDIDYSNKVKIAYVLKIPHSEDYGLLIKRSDDVPKNQNECFDVARDNPTGEIGVVQSYNSESPNPPFLRYGEIELQLNMFKTIENTSHSKARHELIAYIGKKDEIFDAVEKYLSVSDVFMFTKD